ncbi:hypothetical protein [Embleya sp. MST-111070]|uniref:hypothetical protein n=1 Tax=Embleya sp. MST-111070 TaxID=3398231 RepID=UPI003F73FFED
MPILSIAYCNRIDEIYYRPVTEDRPRPAHMQLDVETGHLSVGVDLANDTHSPQVAHGFRRQWSIPLLCGDAVNQLLYDIAQDAQNIVNGAERIWDGSVFCIRLNTAAADADASILARCAQWDDQADHRDLLQVHDPSDWIAATGRDEFLAEHDIGPATSCERLAAITDYEVERARQAAGVPHVVIPGLHTHLRALRDELRRRDAAGPAERARCQSRPLR